VTIKQQVGRWLFAHLPVTRSMFDQLRFEANSWLVKVQNLFLPGRREVLAHVRALRGALVNVACGPQVLDGFVNVDLLGPPPRIRWDCRRSLPLADGGAAGIRAEQFVEHLDTREELPDFLRDCLRVLEPGGVLRIIVPDAARYLRAYCRPDLDGFASWRFPIHFRTIYRRAWTSSTTFSSVGRTPLGVRLRDAVAASADSRFRRHRAGGLPAVAPAGTRADRDVHAPYSLYVDAVKSA
jgi:predicted SAM-dependent methyltransferase